MCMQEEFINLEKDVKRETKGNLRTKGLTQTAPPKVLFFMER